MALDYVSLPKKPLELARTIEDHAEKSYSRYAWRRLMWKLYHTYLNGTSLFTKIDESTNLIEARKVDEEGQVPFRTEILLDNLDKLQSKMQSMDWSPAVEKNNSTLSGIRERAAALALAQSLFKESAINSLKSAVAFNLTVYGCTGLQVNVFNHPMLGVSAEMEVVHPSEVYPFPLSDMDPTKERGRMRRHVVTYESLVDMLAMYGVTAQSLGRKKKNMRIEMGSPSDTLEVERVDSMDGGDAEGLVRNGLRGGPDASKEIVEHVLITQVWLFGQQDLVTRYIVQSGTEILLDMDMSQTKAYCPLAWSCAIQTGTFYGASQCDKLFLLNRKIDQSIEGWLDNLDAEERYGVTLLPASSIDGKVTLQRDEKSKFQYAFWSPDGSVDGTPRPTHIKPGSNNQGLAQATAFLDALAQRLGMPEILSGSAPGRVDSMAGLAFLDENASHSMGSLSNAVRNLFQHVYKAGVQQALGLMNDGNAVEVRLGRIDASLVGLRIDPYSGKLYIGGETGNNIPDLSYIDFTTKEYTPRSTVARKTEALELVKVGLSDRTGLMMLDLKEGLDFAWWSAAEKGAIEVVERNIVFMYNDGVTPMVQTGETRWVTLVDPRSAYPDVQLPVLKAFMQGPEFAAASAEVQQVFYDYESELKRMLMPVLPEGWPTMDEAAMMSQLSQMAQGGGQPPPTFQSPPPQ